MPDFAGVLSAKPAHPRARLVGLEHEYRAAVRGSVLDFRLLVHGLGLGQPQLDPGDPNAYRLPSGAILTADDVEAEIALPPVRYRTGFISDLVWRAATARAALQELLPGISLEGYSTHLSVEVSDAIVDRLARLYTRTFGPAMMLLLERRTSPGLLVRPRSRRIELGGEFVDGAHLKAAAAFAVGSVSALAETVRTRAIPPIVELAGHVVPDDHRYGWFVHRSAFGPDLYTDGRDADLPLASGRTINAQRHLEACWAVARAALAPMVGTVDLEPTDAVVAGDLPLPSEGSIEADEIGMTLEPPEPSPFGEIAKVRRRPGVQIAPVMLTWDTSVLVAIHGTTDRRVFINVPRDYLEPFLNRFDAGDLDGFLQGCLAARPGRRTLQRHSQTLRPGVYDRLGPRSQLLAPERPPMRAVESGFPGRLRAALTHWAA